MYSEERFLRRIEEEFNELGPNSLSIDDRIRDILEWDSFNALMFLSFISMEFDLDFEFSEIEDLNTLRELHEEIASRLEE